LNYTQRYDIINSVLGTLPEGYVIFIMFNLRIDYGNPVLLQLSSLLRVEDKSMTRIPTCWEAGFEHAKKRHLGLENSKISGGNG